MKPLLRDGAVVALIAVVGIALLIPDQRAFIRPWPWTGLPEILPDTVGTAIKVWAFWGAGAAIIAALLRRFEPALDTLDAALAGCVGVWIFAWVGGNLLGPIGLLRTATLWLLLAAGAVWRGRNRPRFARPPISTGVKLALLTTVLMVPGLVIVQLGSPVPPFMDILATPAAAQRIATFGRYLPFDNDPYGYWNPSSQLPGLELFYALLAIGTRSLAVLADTAAITPMACLLIAATYRLGKSIAGDLVGGFATLFISATILFHTLPYMHGRFVTFVPVAIGLAFVLAERRTPTHLVVAALALGTAVATHAIMGALGMLVAAFALLAGGPVSVLAGVAVMLGASLVGLPTVHVGLGIRVPYPVLPLEQLAGVALIVFAARYARPRAARDVPGLRWIRWAFVLLAAYGLLWHPPGFMPGNHQARFPLLVYAGGLGLLAMLWMDARGERPRLGAVAFALLSAMAIAYASDRWRVHFADPGVQVAIYDWFYKVDYWLPYALIFPSAALAALVARLTSVRVATAIVLVLLFVPWRHALDPTSSLLADPNYHQHTIAESWSYMMETGIRGHWGNTRDRRWAQSPAELALSRALLREVAAGRITPATHIVHLSAFVSLYQDVALFSVYTGINDDPYLTDHVFNSSDAGSRLRPIEEVPARLAERPPYVLIHNRPSIELPKDAFRGYEEIFNEDGLRLLRADDVR